jgi:hypothetical protein
MHTSEMLGSPVGHYRSSTHNKSFSLFPQLSSIVVMVSVFPRSGEIVQSECQIKTADVALLPTVRLDFYTSMCTSLSAKISKEIQLKS